MTPEHKFLEEDIGKQFVISRECAEYATYNDSLVWLKNHVGQQVIVLELDDMAWSAKVRSENGDVGWAYKRELIPARQPSLLLEAK